MTTKKVLVCGFLAVILALAFTACNENNNDGPVSNLNKWTAITNNTFGADDSINAIACGNEGGDGYILVAGGADGKMAYSWDGIEWTAVEDSTFYNTSTSYGYAINAIAYGSDGDVVNRFVAVGGSGKMAYSDDGITWTAVEDSTFGTSFNTIYAIAYGGGKFVAGGANGEMAYSDDGVTWTAVEDRTIWEYTDNGSTNNAHIYAIAYGNNKWVAGGTYGKMAFSADGVTWTAVSSPFPKDMFTIIQGIVYGGGKFVAVSSDPEHNIAYSANGENWTAVPLTSSNIHGGIVDIAYGYNRFVAAYGEGIVYSTNGISWTYVLVKIFSNTVINAVAYDGNNAFIAVGGQGKMAYAMWLAK